MKVVGPALLLLAEALFGAAAWAEADAAPQPLAISANRRFLQTGDGKPFFWLGDTAWKLFQQLDRAETLRYLDDRQRKGYNVIQCMVLHTGNDRAFNGAAALTAGDPGRPLVTPGNDLEKAGEYDYWDHVDWVVDQAAARGIYVGMVASWGSIVQRGALNVKNVEAYGRFLAERYKTRPNIVWMTGGDVLGSRNPEVWRTLGKTFKSIDPEHLVTYHPFGRTRSATWFHNEPWLDFNMFQSGHRRYDQDTEPGARGEDNWRYVADDYGLTPVKPTIDGEPSYEGIPQGLHDAKQPRWNANDCRRYAYWAVFAGAFGHTYGHNAVMQMYKGPKVGSYGNTTLWSDAIGAPGAEQMQYLKNLVLARPFFERIPDQGLLAGENGARYDYVVATRGQSYAFLYSYAGKRFRVQLGRISGRTVRASWYCPRDGKWSAIGEFPNRGVRDFTPPGAPAEGKDWVLVLDDRGKGFPMP